MLAKRYATVVYFVGQTTAWAVGRIEVEIILQQAEQRLPSCRDAVPPMDEHYWRRAFSARFEHMDSLNPGGWRLDRQEP